MPYDKLMAPSGAEGLKRIEGHVLEKARAEAEEIGRKAREEAEGIGKAVREEADRKLKADIERLVAELDASRDREVSGRGTARRQEILADKSRVIETVFREAAERLLKDKGYWDLLRRRLEGLAGEKGRVLCRAEHRETFAKYIDELNRETGGKVPPLADGSAHILGGFVLHAELCDLDFTLESDLAALRERILPELAAKAFPNT